ncbi:MAG: hypothetical protein MJ246_01970 [Clostridia bacterium]|nr:hypothetical protein [Clostridia bacterium]
MIVHNSSEATDDSTQGTGSATCLDKVRLFTDKELRITSSLDYTDISMPFKYGFTESDSPVGFDSNKLGFATDYTLLKYTDPITSYTYIGKDKIGLNTVNYWLNNRVKNNGQNSLNLMYNAGTQNSSPKQKAFGIRPIITIIFDNFDDVDITLEANPRSYHDFAFWKIDGVRDTTNTNCLYGSSVDLDKLIKTKAIFTSQVEATINAIDYTSYYLPNENGEIKGYIN